MDGWHMTGLDDNFPIRQALPVGVQFGARLAGLSFPEKDLCNILYAINITSIPIASERWAWVN